MKMDLNKLITLIENKSTMSYIGCFLKVLSALLVNAC